MATLNLSAGDRLLSQEPGSFWIALGTEKGHWAFSFDGEALAADIRRNTLQTVNELDPDLIASLTPVNESVGRPITRRSMAPELPELTVTVRAADPDALDAQKRQTRMLKQLITLTAVLSAVVGMFTGIRLVNRELDEARVKADFAANVSHELRSPITQIRLKAEALQMDLVFEDELEDHYGAIIAEADRLARLVDNVLDFSSIERGHKRYVLRRGDLREVLLKAADVAQHAAESAGVNLVVSLPDDLPAVAFDRDAMSQVATNLLSNAIKYGKDGKRVYLAAEAHDDGSVSFLVRDHGIGSAPGDLDRVFQHFYRVSSSDVRKQRGTGIGLTIVRYIVDAHGGEIEV